MKDPPAECALNQAPIRYGRGTGADTTPAFPCTARMFRYATTEKLSMPMLSTHEHCPIALSRACKHYRESTRAYLTRQVETDFTVVGVLSSIFTCCIYILNLYTQIQQISEVCAMGYICPLGSNTAGFPIVAPPVHYRNLTNIAVVSSGSTPTLKLADSWVSVERAGWGARVHETCGQDDDGCQNPGYEVQWPYIQGSESNAQGPCNPFVTRNVCSGNGVAGCDFSQQDQVLDTCSRSWRLAVHAPFKM